MKLLYIAGDNRSGSTMLDMMLAGHTKITSVGEAHQLRAYVEKDREQYKSVHELLCFCGKAVNDCEFWVEVEKKLGRPLSTLDLKLFFLRSDFKGRPVTLTLKKLTWLLLQLRPDLYNVKFFHQVLGGERIAKQSFDLYDAVSRASGCAYVLDSSKSPFRMRTLAYHKPEVIKVILLCRDFRGVLYSKVKRGVSLKKAALHWKWCIQQMELYSQFLPEANICRVRYEDLCMNTDSEMRRILEFLGLSFEKTVLNRITEGVHHLGGSPSKYVGKSRPITLDASYKKHLSSRDLNQAYKLVRKEAALWGYE